MSGSFERFASQPLAAFASQLPKPAVQAKPQAPAAHEAVALAGTGHTVQVAPHAAGSLGATHLSPHFVKPALQVKPHAFAAQVALPLAGTGHTVQSGPHAVASVFVLQTPPQAWKFALQVNPHTPVVHVVVEFATSGHFWLQPPQWFVLDNGSMHSGPHASGAIGVQPFVHWNDAPAGAQSGFAAPQTALQDPQVVAFERSVSQPSPGVVLQSA